MEATIEREAPEAGATALWNGSTEKNPDSQTRIRFQDCDPFGHLNNARYLDYFINAREAHLRDTYGLDIYGERFQERNWVVRSSMVSHLSPAIHNQVVRIQTRLLNHSRSGLIVEGIMTDAERDRILATGWVDFRYFEIRSGRPARHDGQLMEMFAAIQTGDEFTFGPDKARLNKLKRDLAA